MIRVIGARNYKDDIEEADVRRFSVGLQTNSGADALYSAADARQSHLHVGHRRTGF